MKDNVKKRRGISRREAMKALGVATATAGIVAGCGGPKMESGKPGKKLLILGFDGMDYNLTNSMMENGELPNFAKVAKRGTFLPLISSTPPQSPVAWSNFITGKNPGGHGIFDFIARDPKTYLPEFSLSKVSGSEQNINIGGNVIPVTSGKVELLRKGKAWWKTLEDNGIPSTVINVPSNFPPVKTKQRSISGMGTPDILGTYGTFSFYTTEPVDEGKVQGGKIYRVEEVEGAAECELLGPKNTMAAGSPDVTIPFMVYADMAARQARVAFPDRDVVLRQGEWSDWVRLRFRLNPLASVMGVVRIYLKSVQPHLRLYISPVNIDPSEPSVPISTPDGYSGEVADALGTFYTQGIPEDTWALNEGRLDDDEFLAQAAVVRNERTAVYKMELDRFRRAGTGAYFCYFGTTDTGSHMFWRHRDPQHPMYDPKVSPKYAGTIEGFYREMDKIVGHALSELPEDVTIMIMSDHGFSPFRRAFHLNTWLHENGYLAYADESKGESGELFDNVDWGKTKAYAIGLNSLYINLEGREGQGIVKPSGKPALVAEIAAKLAQFRDPKDGGQAVSEAYDSSKIYSGNYVEIAPDIIVGYSGGYRSSWETALGKAPKEIIRDNDKRWSGDHCMDPSFVPGIFFCSRPAGKGSVRIEDIAPSILAHFGVKQDEPMDGKSFL